MPVPAELSRPHPPRHPSQDPQLDRSSFTRRLLAQEAPSWAQGSTSPGICHKPLLGHHHPPLGGDLGCHLRVPISPPVGMKPGMLCSRPGLTKLDKNRGRRPGNHITARLPASPSASSRFFISASGAAFPLQPHCSDTARAPVSAGAHRGSGPRVSSQGTSSSSWLPGPCLSSF